MPDKHCVDHCVKHSIFEISVARGSPAQKGNPIPKETFGASASGSGGNTVNVSGSSKSRGSTYAKQQQPTGHAKNTEIYRSDWVQPDNNRIYICRCFSHVRLVSVALPRATRAGSISSPRHCSSIWISKLQKYDAVNPFKSATDKKSTFLSEQRPDDNRNCTQSRGMEVTSCAIMSFCSQLGLKPRWALFKSLRRTTGASGKHFAMRRSVSAPQASSGVSSLSAIASCASSQDNADARGHIQNIGANRKDARSCCFAVHRAVRVRASIPCL